MKKISLIENVHMDQKWSPAKVLGKYFEVYGQARPITLETGEKKAPFSRDSIPGLFSLWRHWKTAKNR